MKLFQSETKMQQWLSEKFATGNALSDLIVNYEEFIRKSVCKNNSMVSRKIANSFQYCLTSFHNNEVITENTDISLNPKDRLCPDFLIYAPETQSVVIIELKNIKGPTRQVGTEIGAYAAEVKTYMPFLSEGDIVNVIISSEWPTLLRHYVFNEIVWLDRNLICLAPIDTTDGIMLEIIDPKKITETEVSLTFSPQQIGGYHLCLYDDELQSGSSNYSRLDEFQDKMLSALQAMAAKGNAIGAHGFAFLWRHVFPVGLAPYNITVTNLAAFKSPKLYSLREQFPSNQTVTRLVKIVRDHDPEGHGQALEAITDYGHRFLTGFCSPKAEGYSTWEQLKPSIFERTDAIAFVAWGIFGELFFDRLAKEYDDIDSFFTSESTNPLLAIEMLNEIIY